jgi:hypothetical protein
MGRLDRVSTHTRLARQGISTIGKSLTHTTQGRTTRPILFTYSETKVRAFNGLPVTSYRHGYSRGRRGNSTSVKSHFLPPIPGWEVKTCHYTHHTAHCFATYHPRGRIRQGPYPTISGIQAYPPILDPPSTQPRPTIGQQGGKADVAHDSRSFHRLVPYITMVSGDGRPFLGHVATATPTGIDKTSPQDSPSVSASSYPIKGWARALQGGRTKQDASQKPSANRQRHTTHRSTSQAISFVLSLFL